MTGEPTRNALEERMTPGLLFSSERTPQLLIAEIAKWPLRFIFSCFHLVTQHYK